MTSPSAGNPNDTPDTTIYLWVRCAFLGVGTCHPIWWAVNDEQAADLLGFHYQKISRLNFSVQDKNIKIRASRIVHGCRNDTHRGTSIFSRDFRVNELEAAIGDFCLNKSPDPGGIYGQMIGHLGLSGRQRFLNIINCS
ncbi:hypothetical protein TNCV_2352851 [Trichonephila clavipes]|nr:hypothetical protein TNCV_2352851 [Trichonephila clavipes]